MRYLQDDVFVAHKGGFGDGGVKVRRVGFLDAFAQAAVEHCSVEAFDDGVSVGAGSALRRRGAFVGDLNDGGLQFGIGFDGKQGFFVVGNGIVFPRRRVVRVFEIGEGVENALLDFGAFKIADGHNRRQVRAVPFLVEVDELRAGNAFDDLDLADGQPLRIARSVKNDGQLFVVQSSLGASAGSPFLDNDAAFLVNFFRLKLDAPHPVFQHLEGGLDHFLIIGGNFQHINRFVKRSVGVEVGSKAHSNAFQEVDQFQLLEVFRAVKSHVFEEVSQAKLRFGFHQGAGVDDQTEQSAVLRLLIFPNVVAQAVWECFDRDGGIDGKRRFKIRLRRRA